MNGPIDFSVIFDGGPVMLPLVAVSFVLWYFILKELLVFRHERGNRHREYFPRVVELVRRGTGQEALAVLARHPGLLSRVLRQGVQQAEKGKEPVEHILRETMSREFPLIGRAVSTIGALAAAAPLLGLLGTISGMITTFEVISVSGTGEPEFMARGISEALITTQTGLIIGIPGILFYIYLSSRVKDLKKRIERRVDQFLACLEEEPAGA